MYAHSQFQWGQYEGIFAVVDGLAREEVVAHLKRSSTGFSRRAPGQAGPWSSLLLLWLC